MPQATARNRLATNDHAQECTGVQVPVGGPLSANREKLPPILLIYDCHGSHTTLEWITHARTNNIILFCLIPHTTHRLQPLDVGCFGPLQAAWFEQCDEILDETGEGMEMKDVVKEYFEAQKKAFKETTILKVWKNAGLHLINPNIFTAADFTPSHGSSIKCHAPSTFPSRMPHVPDASSDIEVFDPSTIQPSSDNEDINYGSIRLDSDNDESNSDSSEDEGGSRQAIRSNGQAWEVQNNTVETELDTHSHLSDSSRATTPGIVSQDTLSTQSPPFRTRSQRQTILDNLNPPTTRTNSNSIETIFGSNILDYKMAVRVLQKELEHTRAQRDAAETHASGKIP